MKAATTLVLACLALWAPSAFGQRSAADLTDQIDRVAREFERTDELLQRVGPMVRESNAPRPREIFARARALQDQGRVALEASRTQLTNERPIIAGELARKALGLTLQARELAQRAGAMLREEVGFEERARRAIEELERRIDRARDHDVADDSRDAALLAEAIEQLETAQKHFADHNFEVAFRIAESALRLLDNANDGRARPGADRLMEELRRTRELYERVSQHQEGFDDRSQQAFERAGRLLQDAERAAQERDGRRAHRMLQEAQRLLRQLMERRGPTAQDVERAMVRVDAAMQRLEDLRDELPADAVDLVERAAGERASARESLDSEDFDRALTHLRAALDLLDRARRLSGRD